MLKARNGPLICQFFIECEIQLNQSWSFLNLFLKLIDDHDNPYQEFFRESNVSRYFEEKISNASVNIYYKKRHLLMDITDDFQYRQ